MENTSNCCGAPIIQPDKNGHGKCKNCGENCVPLEMEDNQEPDYDEIARDFQADLEWSFQPTAYDP